MKNKRNVSAEITAQQYYSGPLPPPDALIRYNEAVPSAAERIIQMAEKEMEHRQEMERKMMKSRIRTAYISIVFAFVAICRRGVCHSSRHDKHSNSAVTWCNSICSRNICI